MPGARATALFRGFRLDDAGTEAEIRRLHAARATSRTRTPPSASPPPGRCPLARGVPVVAVATAHPAKFPEAMERATGLRPPLPPRLADLYDRTERYTVAPNDLAAVEAGVRAVAQRNAA